MKIVFFEDHNYNDLDPISISHPSYMLLCGTSKIYQKWLNALVPDEFSFWGRPYLAEILEWETGKTANKLPDDELLFINGRFLPNEDILKVIEQLGTNEALISVGCIAACRLGSGRSKNIVEALEQIHTIDGHEKIKSLLKSKEIKTDSFQYLWDLININGRLISDEFNMFNKSSGSLGAAGENISIIRPESIFIHKSASIAPNVVIDASDGPVIIEEKTSVEPFSYIQGPCYIGPDNRIVGGRIREGCSFGPMCRIGGEVEESIMLGFCNKYHEGFLGHAYLGEWVNLGALTTNSDLKNNYKEIKAAVGDKTVHTKSIKVGSFIGDHTKTGIGTMLNTGINIGFSCNLYGAGLFSEKKVPPFSWGTPDGLVGYRIDKAIDTAKTSMARRKVSFTSAHGRLFRSINEINSSDVNR